MIKQILAPQIPDFSEWQKAKAWVHEGRSVIKKSIPTDAFVAMEWVDIAEEQTGPFGLYASENFRKFVLATFLADLVSYSDEVDQVGFDRLLFVMHGFIKGFRTWWVKIEDRWWPVGYTGWYPMLKTAYLQFKERPETLTSRMVVPTTNEDYLYLFNFSASPQFKKSNLSKSLMKLFVEDINTLHAKGLACITVSEDGERAASRFGMSCSGYLQIGQSKETIYTT